MPTTRPRVADTTTVEVSGRRWNLNADEVDAVIARIEELERQTRAKPPRPEPRYRIRLTGKRLDDVSVGQGETVRLIRYSWVRVLLNEFDVPLENDEQPNSTVGEDDFSNYATNLAELHIVDEEHSGIPFDPDVAELQPIVEVYPVSTRKGDRSRLVFERALPEAFPVKLEVAGGSAGSKTAPASFVYTMTDLDNNPLAKTDQTPVGPDRRRTRIGKVDPPDDGDFGVALWRRGKLVLWDANEVPSVKVCEDTPVSTSRFRRFFTRLSPR